MFKCTDCKDKYNIVEDLYEHYEEEHGDSISPDFTISQHYYYRKTGRGYGNCVVCKGKTLWNETTSKYHRFCTNPKCKEEYREIFKSRMIGKHGKISLLKDPAHQRKMLANRSISGTYIWSDGAEFTYTGTYELDFLKFLDKILGFESSDIMFPSPHTYTYMYENEEKFYFPDGFIISLNAEIEIKESDNTHPKIMAVDKVKEKLKDDVLTSQKSFNYLKLVDKNNIEFLKFLDRLKDEFEKNPKQPRLVHQVDRQIKYAVPVTESVAIDNFKSTFNTMDNSEKKYPIFIALTYTGNFSNNSKVSKSEYNYISISLDPSMTKLYSFDRQTGSFIKESFMSEQFQRVKDHCTYSIYVTHVTANQQTAMYRLAEAISENKEKLEVDASGLFTLMLGCDSFRDNEPFCSQFITEILNKADAIIEETPSFYAPLDDIRHNRFMFVSKGVISNYDSDKVRKIVANGLE